MCSNLTQPDSPAWTKFTCPAKIHPTRKFHMKPQIVHYLLVGQSIFSPFLSGSSDRSAYHEIPSLELMGCRKYFDHIIYNSSKTRSRGPDIKTEIKIQFTLRLQRMRLSDVRTSTANSPNRPGCAMCCGQS